MDVCFYVGYTLTDAFPSILNSSFPLTLSLSGPDVSLPVSVIQALKSGCATIEQLLQLSTFLLSYGAALEASHSGKIIFFLVRITCNYTDLSQSPFPLKLIQVRGGFPCFHVLSCRLYLSLFDIFSACDSF